MGKFYLKKDWKHDDHIITMALVMKNWWSYLNHGMHHRKHGDHTMIMPWIIATIPWSMAVMPSLCHDHVSPWSWKYHGMAAMFFQPGWSFLRPEKNCTGSSWKALISCVIFELHRNSAPQLTALEIIKFLNQRRSGRILFRISIPVHVWNFLTSSVYLFSQL